MERSSSLLLLLLLLLFISSFIITSTTASRAVPAAKTTNTEFIKNSCIATTYPRLCVSSLMDHASAIQTSPRLLTDTALSVTLRSASSASAAMSTLLSRPGMRPREVAAMRDCVETMGASVDELRSSVSEMGHLRRPDIGMQMSDLQTWVSAALTNEDTCMDGFAGDVMNGAVKTMVRNRIVNVAHLTSNALALINKLASSSP